MHVIVACLDFNMYSLLIQQIASNFYTIFTCIFLILQSVSKKKKKSLLSNIPPPPPGKNPAAQVL